MEKFVPLIEHKIGESEWLKRMAKANAKANGFGCQEEKANAKANGH